MPSPPAKPPTASAPLRATPPPPRPAASAPLAAAQHSITFMPTASGTPCLSTSIRTELSIAVVFLMSTSIVACVRISHASPKSTWTWSPRMDSSATCDASPATGTPFKPRRISYSTLSPLASATSWKPNGFDAPSTSIAISASYLEHGLNGVNINRTALLPPGGISSSRQSTSKSKASRHSSLSPSGSGDHRNTAGSMVMFWTIISRSTGTLT
mmetsp:Transcript_290/g.1349  ORF Transcript_290/g.1349 Transcript_290/m.1349 type:complete len:213 (+) Transcript_290:2178-2816(+)